MEGSCRDSFVPKDPHLDLSTDRKRKDFLQSHRYQMLTHTQSKNQQKHRLGLIVTESICGLVLMIVVVVEEVSPSIMLSFGVTEQVISLLTSKRADSVSVNSDCTTPSIVH